MMTIMMTMMKVMTMMTIIMKMIRMMTLMITIIVASSALPKLRMTLHYQGCLTITKAADDSALPRMPNATFEMYIEERQKNIMMTMMKAMTMMTIIMKMIRMMTPMITIIVASSALPKRSHPLQGTQGCCRSSPSSCQAVANDTHRAKSGHQEF